MKDPRISVVNCRRLWDSRGRPTIEVEIETASGSRGRAIAPAGASTGSGEALDLRDGGLKFGGFDVRKAVTSVRDEISPVVIGKDVRDQTDIDQMMIRLDGTPDKSRLGGNALIATSMAVLHAAAAHAGLPLWRYLAGERPVHLPLPEIQIFGGGAHAARRVDVQDFMIMCPSATTFSEALDWTAEVYRAAGSFMKSRGKLQGVADEGGFWPAFSSNEEALDSLMEAIILAGFKPGDQVAISLDVAASEFGKNGLYNLALDNRQLDSGGMIALLTGWLKNYPIISIEDPLAEDDVSGFIAFTKRNGSKCQIIGDDFLVTKVERVRMAAEQKAVNAVLIKPNQAGTITETHEALVASQESGFNTIVSARSGESEDVSIAHLAVGWNAGQLKVGSFSRSERMAKWNEVLRIEEQLGSAARFTGWSVFPHLGK